MNLGLSQDVMEHFENQTITAAILGFHGTSFPLWKLGSLLGDQWVHEDVLNGLSELLYFRTAVSGLDDTIRFIYLPTLVFNDAQRLFNITPRTYSPNLASLRLLLMQDNITTIGFNVWHNNHFHAFHYNTAQDSGPILHGDSQHSLPPDDVLPIITWLLVGTPYERPINILEGDVECQGPGAYGSCAIVAHNFIEYREDPLMPQWTAAASPVFRDQALLSMIIYHYSADDDVVCVFVPAAPTKY